MHRFPLLFILLLLGTVAAAQGEKKTPAIGERENFEESFEKEYQRRIKKEYLYRVYIPKDLADAFIQLNRLTDKESLARFKNASEEVASRKLHFSLGRWMIHNWGFYGGSRLSHYLRNIGISHPDDMARFIIITYHRNLNKQKLEVKALIEKLRADRQTEVEKRRTILHEETRQRPKN
ncbi:MAG: DUF6794 domain-containing protein [Bacteroidota bacterium]